MKRPKTKFSAGTMSHSKDIVKKSENLSLGQFSCSSQQSSSHETESRHMFITVIGCGHMIHIVGTVTKAQLIPE